LGITEFSFSYCLKIFFLLIFIFFNIFLIYIESKDKKKSALHCGPGPEMKKLAHNVVIAIGVISGLLTIKNEYNNQAKIASDLAAKTAEISSLQEKLAKQAEKFQEDISKEKDEEKIISLINGDDINKSSIFDFEFSKY
jgi:uncharacterized membrane protein